MIAEGASTDQDARRSYRVDYDYSHGQGAWFEFRGTDAEFMAVLALIFQEPFEVYTMKIRNWHQPDKKLLTPHPL